MTKEEKIQKAYKRFWQQLPKEAQEQALQNNGFIAHKFIGNEYGRLYNLLKMQQTVSSPDSSSSVIIYRPISLIGIETNNG